MVWNVKCIFQLLDLPGIIEGAKDGKGRGRQVIAVARTCSLIFIVLDVLKPLGHKRLIEHELEGFGLRLNKQPPNITFRKKDKGGINFQTTVIERQGEEKHRELHVIRFVLNFVRLNYLFVYLSLYRTESCVAFVKWLDGCAQDFVQENLRRLYYVPVRTVGTRLRNSEKYSVRV